MKFFINKVAYNILDFMPEKEKISFNITAKFGVETEDYSKRAFFIELNAEGKYEGSGEESRSLCVEAHLNYQLDKSLFLDLDENQIEEDKKYFIILLERLNESIKNITSQDDLGRPLNIDKAIEDIGKEG